MHQTQSATSSIDEFKPGTSFKPVIDDETAAKNPQKYVLNLNISLFLYFY